MSNSMTCFGALLARYTNGIQPMTSTDALTEYLAEPREPGAQRRAVSQALADLPSTDRRPKAPPEGR